MTLATVCIPICHETYFLNGSIREMLKHKHENVDYEILVMDQTVGQNTRKVEEICYQYDEVKVVKTKKIDAGYPLDIGARMAKGEYFCSLDADAFPVHKNWLNLPIKIIEKFGVSFVGNQTGLQNSYEQFNFLHINNYYRVSTTEVARKISEEIGFIRPQNKPNADIAYNRPNIIEGFADNGVQAQIFADQEGYGPKFSVPIDTFIGRTPQMGIYGMILGGLVFHMVFGQTIQEYHPSWLGEDYFRLLKKIHDTTLTEELAKELVSLSSDDNHDFFYFSGNESSKVEVLNEENEIVQFYKREMQS